MDPLLLKAGEMARGDCRRETLKALEKVKINSATTARLLKRELKATETEFFKMKKASADPNVAVKKFLEDLDLPPAGKDNKLPKGVRIIYETPEELLLAVDVASLKIRQEARRDIHRIRGDYAAERQHITGGITHEITFDSVPQDEREALMAASRIIQEQLTKSGDTNT